MKNYSHTIQEIYRPTNSQANRLAPTLRLTGKILKEIGLARGSRVKVTQIGESLIITKA